MNFTKIAKFTLTPLAVCFLHLQCQDSDKQPGPCDCQSKSVKKEEKNIEAVVVHIMGNQPGGNQGPDKYVLRTAPRDFDGVTYSLGKNMLVPCRDSLSLPVQFRKPGLKVNVSYRRKDCYGALTSPYIFGAYGYYIDLTAIGVTNP
ncbi:hypothetical protein L0657_22780 [Dyadobacter sp. CY345]|uniref:hypothetical protein n=1 Tax=Dyadobacter sp. CY345 TaxID=2909335 RepID=UPI001F487DAB|nr:hypothetical protein [Dyadobacter sp. CY345]MCF2446799.1 hypothetical protein [Dyadobacter sp. CY345]